MLNDPNDFRAMSKASNPAVRIYKNTATTLTTATATTIVFTTVRFDPFGMWSSGAATKLTVKVAGIYMAGAHLQYATNSGGQRTVILRRNGSGAIGSTKVAPEGGGAVTQIFAIGIWEMVGDDYVEVRGRQDSGNDLDIDAGTAAISTAQDFWMVRIG